MTHNVYVRPPLSVGGWAYGYRYSYGYRYTRVRVAPSLRVRAHSSPTACVRTRKGRKTDPNGQVYERAFVLFFLGYPAHRYQRERSREGTPTSAGTLAGTTARACSAIVRALH